MNTVFYNEILHCIIYIIYYRQALKIKPLQPELLNLVGEVAGLARDIDSMHTALRRNIEIVDDLAVQGLAAISLASMYHKIGHNYIKVLYYCAYLTYSNYLSFSMYK